MPKNSEEVPLLQTNPNLLQQNPNQHHRLLPTQAQANRLKEHQVNRSQVDHNQATPDPDKQEVFHPGKVAVRVASDLNLASPGNLVVSRPSSVSSKMPSDNLRVRNNSNDNNFSKTQAARSLTALVTHNLEALDELDNKKQALSSLARTKTQPSDDQKSLK